MAQTPGKVLQVSVLLNNEIKSRTVALYMCMSEQQVVLERGTRLEGLKVNILAINREQQTASAATGSG